MGLFSSNKKPSRALVNDHEIHCLICRNNYFWTRWIKLNSAGMEFLDLAWANKSALGLVCSECGYIHEFLNENIALIEDE